MRAMGSAQKKAQIDVTFILNPVESDVEKYPTTILGVDLTITKDRHGGVISACTAPEEPQYAGRFVLDNAGPLQSMGAIPEGYNIDRMESKFIPGYVIRGGADKRIVEEKQRRINAVAQWLSEQPSPVNTTALKNALGDIVPMLSKRDRDKFIRDPAFLDSVTMSEKGTARLYTAVRVVEDDDPSGEVAA